MYQQYFGLTQEPFSIAPDPRYLFMSERHREALAHLLYGVSSGGGFVLLTGEIGAGKTTVCQCFLQQVPAQCNVAYIFNPGLSARELLQTICQEFHLENLPAQPSQKDLVDRLNQFLLRSHAEGRNNVLVIDEAQNLAPAVLEQLRLLTNLETRERKLLQIILIGQPELRVMLSRPELEQVAQRVIARFHLSALSTAETAQYITHRLGVAGHARGTLFPPRSVERIHRITRGIPRRINLLCDRALLGAWAENAQQVEVSVVEKAAREVFDLTADMTPVGARPASSKLTRPMMLGIGAAVVASSAVAGAIGWWLHAQRTTADFTRLAAQPAPRATGLPAGVALPARAAGQVVPPSAASAASTASDARTGAAPLAAPPLISAREFDEWLAQPHDARADTQAAWSRLLPLWSQPTGPARESDPCANLPQGAVMCFRSPLGLPLVRQLDRPVLLRMEDGGPTERWLLLTHLDGQHATLMLGSDGRKVPLDALARHWRGDFLTLWRIPPGYQHRLEAGDRGPAVDWLAAQLARVKGEQVPEPGRSMDPTLVTRVAAFQLTQGLKSDGVAGATTFMLLNRVAGVAEPHLLSFP